MTLTTFMILVPVLLVVLTVGNMLVKEVKKTTTEVSVTPYEKLLAEKEELNYIKSQREEILKEIKAKEKELETLQNAVHTFKNRSTSNLPLMIEEVLNTYEKQGIHIPVDIIDELGYIVLENKEQAYKYIEAQRQAWKLKNSQKLVKGLI